MRAYRTKQGDTWDAIAHEQLGDVALTDKLMQRNGALLGYYIFPAGVVLELPDVEVYRTDAPVPWKQVSG